LEKPPQKWVLGMFHTGGKNDLFEEKEEEAGNSFDSEIDSKIKYLWSKGNTQFLVANGHNSKVITLCL